MEGRAEADGTNRRPQGWRERREHVENKRDVSAISLDLHNHPQVTRT